MYIESWCQRADIRRHLIRSTTKNEAMMQKANVSLGKTQYGQECEKETITLRSSFKDVVSSASRSSWCGAIVDGNKKVTKKQINGLTVKAISL
ncbi:hypothetical protein [Absidia glauca]|uniref:Uncharacterized protein n=1 Tax=Absidia glauca TaxID=4829 RepID=A0A163MIH5_ABSGL|nr:hypothetical protein [Absidia glauca]